MKYLVAVCIASVFAGVVHADDTVPTPSLKVELGGSLLFASGNSSALTVGANIAAKYTTNALSFTTEAKYIQVEGDQAAIENKRAADFAIEYKLTPLVAPYVQASYGVDLQEGILRQATLEGGTSLNVIDTEKHWIIFWLALADTNELQSGIPDTQRFLGCKIGEKQRWPWGAVAINERAVLTWSFANAADMRLTHKIGLEIEISRRLSLEMTHEIDYRRVPSPGKRPLDQLSLVSFTVAFPAKSKS